GRLPGLQHSRREDGCRRCGIRNSPKALAERAATIVAFHILRISFALHGGRQGQSSLRGAGEQDQVRIFAIQLRLSALGLGYSALTPVARTTARQRSASSFISAVIAAGVLPTGSADRSDNRLATSGCFRVSAIARESLSAIAAGVFG